MRSLGLKGSTDWRQYCRSVRKPPDIPASPNSTYKKEWKGWGDWLGTGTIATLKREYLPFEQAREYVHKLRLNSQTEWRNNG